MCSLVLPYMFNPDQANIDSSTNFIFAGCPFALIFLFYFLLPETAGQSYEEVGELFKAEISARKWKKYVTQEKIESEKVFQE